MPRRVTSSARRHKARTPKDEAESPRSARPMKRREFEETEEFREPQIQGAREALAMTFNPGGWLRKKH